MFTDDITKYDQKADSHMWAFSRGGHNAGSAKYYYPPINLADFLHIGGGVSMSGVKASNAFVKWLRAIMGLSSSAVSVKDAIETGKSAN